MGSSKRKINYFWAISPYVFQNLIWPATRFFMVFFGRLSITGLDNLKTIKGPMIFAANHSSEIDPFLVPVSLPFLSRISPIFYITREKSFYDESGVRQFFYGGLLFKLFGGYPASIGLKNYEKSLATHIEILKSGYSLCVFPEGQKTTDGKLREAKGGVAYLAWTANVPVIPVGISGDFKLSLKEFFLRKRNIRVSFGKPVMVRDLIAPKLEPTIVGDIDDFRIIATRVMEIGSDLQD